MSNKNKMIALYNKAMKTGKLPKTGLCGSLYFKKIMNKNIDLFEPSLKEYNQLKKKQLSIVYWGSGLKSDDEAKYSTFTPLRQTILAFLIAMEK